MHDRCRCRVPLALIAIPLAAALLLVTGLLAAAVAQSTADTPVELQETDRFGLGARAMGMGNAMIAVSGDVSALALNPAGLTGFWRSHLSVGLAWNDASTRTFHMAESEIDHTETRLDHVVIALPFPRRADNFVVAFGYHRAADLDARFSREGFLIPATSGSPGLYELEEYRRNGTVDSWTAALGAEVSSNVSFGGSIRVLTGSSREDILLANYRATLSGNDVILDVGSPSDPDDRLFEQRVVRDADLHGITGSLGLQAKLDSGVRLGAVLDLPASLQWEGESAFRLEDWEKIDGNLDGGPPDFFEDDITLPLSLAGGLSFEREGLLLAGGLRWTDWTETDFEGEILEPDGVGIGRESAYRSTIGVNFGGEMTLPRSPVALRAGFMTEPLPYRLMAADPDFVFVADDGDPNTTDDASTVFRDYPEADIRSDAKAFTLGAGVALEKNFRLEGAFVHGSWKRSTPRWYQNSTDFYATEPTVERVSENRFFLSGTARFR